MTSYMKKKLAFMRKHGAWSGGDKKDINFLLDFIEKQEKDIYTNEKVAKLHEVYERVESKRQTFFMGILVGAFAFALIAISFDIFKIIIEGVYGAAK